MEKTSEISTDVIDGAEVRDRRGPPLAKKKRGAMQLIRVAVYMLRQGSRKSKSVQVGVALKGLWKRLVSSIRPLHLPSNLYPSPSPSSEILVSLASYEEVEEVFTQPLMSPAPHWWATSFMESISQYASAVNLQELDRGEENSEEEYGYEMIDAKAEEFIAQFYAQIRLQNQEYI